MLRPRSALAFALVPLAIVACGDDEETPTSATTSSSATATTGASTGTGTTTGSGGSGGGLPEGVHIPGLAGPVTATTDEVGVLHLACGVDEDCFATLGYFHAQNRFFFMDFIRNLVRGSLGGLVGAGPLVLSRDYENRRFFSTREGEPLERALYDQASSETRGLFDAYTRGVNAWITDMREGRNGATLTTEYDFSLIVKEAIRDWEVEDSAAVGLYVMNDLSNNSSGELDAAAVEPAYGPAFGADLFSGIPLNDAFTSPLPVGARPAANPFLTDTSRLVAQRPAFASAAEKMALVAGGAPVPGEVGSNNWLVAPSRSASGNALLANDPHLPLTNPSIWFPAEIDAKSDGEGVYHMAGGTFPGLPAVMIGHNEDITWGVTTAYWDLADVYMEELTPDGTAVMFEGREVPITEKTFEFADVSTGNPVTKTFRYVPHHGPIIEEDLDAGTAISVRWRGHDGGQDVDAFLALARAKSVAEAKAGLAANASSSSQNFIVTDGAGDVGWFPFARLPSRPWASAELPPWLPLPGDGSAEWGPPLSMDDLPQLQNPVNGVIATANADMTGAWADGDPLNDGQAALQTRALAEGARQQRILDLLEEGGDQHTPATMSAMQGDTYSLFGEIVVPALLSAAADANLSPGEQLVVDALTDWGNTCPTGLDGSDPETAGDIADEAVAAEAIGCTAFHLSLYALAQEAVSDDAAAAGVSYYSGLSTRLVARAIAKPETLLAGEVFWDDLETPELETRDDIAMRAITRVAAVLADLGVPNDWRWGRLHTLTLRSIYDNFGVATYNVGRFAAPGGLSTVNVANPINRIVPDAADGLDLGFGHGPSIRLVTEQTASGPVMRFNLPGGADLHRESPFFNNLLPGWLDNELVDFKFGPGAVTDPAVVVEVLPAP